MYNITLIPGDGVGPEVTEALLHIIEIMDIELDYTIAYAGGMHVIKKLELLFLTKHYPKQKKQMQHFLDLLQQYQVIKVP